MMTHNLIQRFDRGSVHIPLGIALVILVGIADYLTGTEVSFSIFYLLPISLVSWFGGIRPGIVFSVICAVMWFMNERIGGHVYSHSIMAYWNTAMRGMIFLMTAGLLSRLKRSLKIEKEAREAANFASSMKSDFLANMSHEIRTPMNSIVAVSDLLTETPLNKNQDEFVQILRREGAHLLKIIDDILDLSKVEAGQFTLENIPFDIRKLIEEIASVIMVRVHEKGLQMVYTVQHEVPVHVIGDPGCLRRILINLLGNAVKFTERGQVAFTVENDPGEPVPGHLLFSVSDTGIGIPESKLNLIFERFTQADASITRNYGGTGLGLSISRKMLETMGGRMWAESVVGQGSTFYFTLPLGIPDSTAEYPEPAPVEIPEKHIIRETDLRPLHILLVEDYEINRRIIKAFLSKTPYRIDEAENGVTAVEKFKSGHYDLVLMDMQMPVMDGYTATRIIRACEKEMNRKPTPILALTAHAYKDDIQKSLNAGCDGHLSKPIKKTTLLEALYTVTASTPGPDTPETAPAEHIRISVPPDYRELVPLFLDEMRNFCRLMQDAAEHNDYDTIRETGHKIKGAGGSYGFQGISDLGASLESAAHNHDIQEIQARLSDMIRYLEHVEVIYE